MLLTLLLACADPFSCPVGFVVSSNSDGDDVCVFDEPSILELVQTFDEGALVKVNAEPYMPPYSQTPIRRNVWVSPVAVADRDEMTAPDLYLTIDQDDWSNPLDDEFPVGTVIIHEAVDGEEAHGVEVKRDDYTDEMGRDWWLRMITDDGVIEETYSQPCSNCHNEGYRPSEGLWGVPEFAK